MANRNIFQRIFGFGNEENNALVKSVEDISLEKSAKDDENVLEILSKEVQSHQIDPMDHSNAYMMQSYEGSDKKYYFENVTNERFNAQVLQNLSQHQIISAIIGARINQVAEFAHHTDDEDLGYKIMLKDKKAEITEDDEKNIAALHNFLQNCGTNISDYELTFESFLRQIVRDSLIYDQCCFEIVKNRKGQITGFLPVDAATIKRAALSKEEIQTGRKNKDGVAYIQVINNKIVAEFKQDELCFGVRRPRTDIKLRGYGNPELFELYSTLNNLFNAETYNASNFTNGINANGIIAVKSKMNPKLFRSFRREFYQMLNGVANAKRTPLIQLDPDEKEDISSVSLGSTNKEMEYNDWINYLIKVACSIYQIDPAEIGFVFGTEAQSSSLFGTDPSARVLMGKEKGLRPLIRSLQTWINRYIIDQIDDRYQLVFTGLDSVSSMDKMKLEEHKMKYMTLNEIRVSHDLPELEDGDILAAAYTAIKTAVIREQGIQVANEVGKDEIDSDLDEVIEEEHEKELELDGELTPDENSIIEEPEMAEKSLKKKFNIEYKACKRSDGKDGKYLLTMETESGDIREFCHLDIESAKQQIEIIEAERNKVEKKERSKLTEKEKKERQEEMDRRKESDKPDYSPLPGDDKVKTKPSKYTKTEIAEKVREEMKKPGKDEFIRAASKVSGVKKKIIEEVWERGAAAWAGSHRPGATQVQWAKARVYSFLSGGKTQQTADKDLWEEHLESKKMAKSEDNFIKGKDTFVPPADVAAKAQKALDAKEKYPDTAGKCGTQVGWTRARQLANRERISIETVKRMYSFFSRHQGNERIATGKEYHEDCGAIMHDAWGGDEGFKWCKEMIEQYDKK